ncbi:MAG TPA: two-component sensor histidine kinase [Oxalobacteraceae bacterium]|nr:two-component sensor histidine kinase [Oxalobacteraceae bacterium]
MKSIRTRLSVFLLLAAMLAAAVIGVATYKNTLRENEELFDYQLRQMALSLRDQGLAAGPDLLEGKDEAALDVVVQIWTSSGAVLYLSRPGNPLFDRVTLGYTDVDAGAKRWRVYGLATRDRVIQVAQPIELRRGLAAAAALRSLAPLLAFAPIMALLIWWLVGDSLSSVKRLATEVGQREARSLDEVSEAGVPLEITPLVRALNALLVRLRRAFSSQRAFVADAAHELRSPLTALKLQLQLLDRAPDDAARLHALEKLHEGVDRATRLIEQLLTAARTDPNDAKISFQPIDLAELVRQAIADVFFLAQERRIGIELQAPEPLVISGDADALRILARNLIDNAIRYSPPGGTLLAGVHAESGHVVLTIEDSGPGIPEEDRGRVFDRFYRREPNQQGGSGLGLTIVKNIAEQHGARIELGVSRYGGLKVSVLFRLSATPPALIS